MEKTRTDYSFKVAIIGGGITGLVLGLGLLRRSVKFTIYERADSFCEIGAGIGFTPNAERAMEALDPAIHASFRKIAVQNEDDYFRYVDGFHHGPQDKANTAEAQFCKMYLGERGFEGCRRHDFIQELAGLMEADCIKFNKCLVSVNDGVVMKFDDGSIEQASVIIGCDGIRSRLRQIMVEGDGDVSVLPGPAYAHKYAFRGLVPMEAARGVLGEHKTSKRFMFLGPDAHVLTFPVAGGAIMNVVAFVTDPKPWTAEHLSEKTTREEAIVAFAHFGPAVRTIISLLPDKLDRWAIFDMYDRPLLRFTTGSLCLAGDAAHAASPHHGAGAGCGIEDALALAELLSAVSRRLGDNVPIETLVAAALETYNEVRYERCQWLVQSSRIVGEMFEWRQSKISTGPEAFARDLSSRCHTIWDFDTEEMVASAHKKFNGKMRRIRDQ
ncbi:hypothetical protein TruAng_009598 [Truncatella angustata]|nr:hypothetical protein TruAng_009598 [Truncatella angustata]